MLLACRKRSGMVVECTESVAIASGWPVPDVGVVKQKREGRTCVILASCGSMEYWGVKLEGMELQACVCLTEGWKS